MSWTRRWRGSIRRPPPPRRRARGSPRSRPARRAPSHPPPPPPAARGARIAALQDGDAPAAPRFASLLAAIGRGAVFAIAAAAGLYLGLSLAPPGTGDSGLELVEASLIAGEAPSIAVVDLLELD